MSKGKQLFFKMNYDIHNSQTEPLQTLQRCQTYGNFFYCESREDDWYNASEDITENLKIKDISNIVLDKTDIDFRVINSKIEHLYYLQLIVEDNIYKLYSGVDTFENFEETGHGKTLKKDGRNG